MTGLASLRCAIGAAPRHALVEFAVVHVGVTRSASPILKMEWQDFVGPSGGTDFVAIGTRHGRVSSAQGEPRFAMFGNRKCGAVKIQNGMTVFALVSIRRGRKLSVMGVLMAVGAGREFHLIDGVLAGG